MRAREKWSVQFRGSWNLQKQGTLKIRNLDKHIKLIKEITLSFAIFKKNSKINKKIFFKGCVIDWRKGKNVTVKTIKKNQKHKSRGSMRTVTKTVQNDSFFNFFSPPVGKIHYLFLNFFLLIVSVYFII